MVEAEVDHAAETTALLPPDFDMRVLAAATAAPPPAATRLSPFLPAIGVDGGFGGVRGVGSVGGQQWSVAALAVCP
ncbi:unnamed protein product [Ceratitis capitata]|uniref:(Mediterranean fruit fly) hypothetical protein n=1 Tax=Ceratitis capitata TaxID=7213 RepID=A0A811UJ76_CERCA|nr:unnamed protein product [Ceratitis capitata]